MEHDLYLIQCNHMSGGMCYYAEHGEKCGVPDAVGYDTAAHARKFRTYEDAPDVYRHTNAGVGKALTPPGLLPFRQLHHGRCRPSSPT